jgi:hypothetical protein
VSGVGNRNGHHHDTEAGSRQNYGGKKEKKSSLEHTPWVPTDAIDGLNVFIENTKRKFTIESPPIEETQHSDDDWDNSGSGSVFQSFSLEPEDKENNEFGAAPAERGI